MQGGGTAQVGARSWRALCVRTIDLKLPGIVVRAIDLELAGMSDGRRRTEVGDGADCDRF